MKIARDIITCMKVQNVDNSLFVKNYHQFLGEGCIKRKVNNIYGIWNDNSISHSLSKKKENNAELIVYTMNMFYILCACCLFVPWKFGVLNSFCITSYYARWPGSTTYRHSSEVIPSGSMFCGWTKMWLSGKPKLFLLKTLNRTALDNICPL